jgi:hypothetical protein
MLGLEVGNARCVEEVRVGILNQLMASRRASAVSDLLRVSEFMIGRARAVEQVH